MSDPNNWISHYLGALFKWLNDSLICAAVSCNMYSLNSYCLTLNFVYWLLSRIWKALNGSEFLFSGIEFSPRAQRLSVSINHVIKEPWSLPWNFSWGEESQPQAPETPETRTRALYSRNILYVQCPKLLNEIRLNLNLRLNLTVNRNGVKIKL